MQRGAALHLAAPKDGRDLGERLGVVVRVEEGEAAREEAQQNNADRPDVERCTDEEGSARTSTFRARKGRTDGLVRALEENLGRTETPRPCAVGAHVRPAVLLEVARLLVALLLHDLERRSPALVERPALVDALLDVVAPIDGHDPRPVGVVRLPVLVRDADAAFLARVELFLPREPLALHRACLVVKAQRLGEPRAMQARAQAGARPRCEALELLLHTLAVGDATPARTGQRVQAVRPPLEPLVAANLLRQAVVAQHALAGRDVVQEVGRLDVAVDDLQVVRRREGAEETREVGAQEGQRGGAVVGLRARVRGQGSNSGTM